MKFLNLNLWKGHFIDDVIAYILKNDIDIIQLQEVSKDISYHVDCLEVLRQALPEYDYYFEAALTLSVKPGSYDGNATFFKKKFTKKFEHTVWLHPFTSFAIHDRTVFKDCGMNAVHVKVVIGDKEISLINAHLAWGPTPEDEPYKVDQGKILFEYMRSLKEPFIFSGDFNVERTSEIVKRFDTIGRNLSTEHNLKNTLNPRVHGVKKLFPPGLAVDFVYVSKDVKIESFKLLEDLDLSDHLGLTMEFSI